MHEQGNWIAVRIGIVLLAGLFLLPPGVGAVSISLEPLSLMPGESGTSNLTLDAIPSGISGYRTGLRLTAPGIAEITGVSFPAWAGLSNQTGFPGSDVTIMAAALGEPLPEEAGRTILAALTLKGIADGTTGLELYDLSIDDAQGEAVRLSIENTSVIVSSATILSDSTPSGSVIIAEETTSGAAGPASMPESMVTTVIPTGVSLQEQTSVQEPSSQQITSGPTHPSVPSSEQTPAVTTPARGIPFLSLAGLLGLLFAIPAIGEYRKKM